MMQDDHSPGKEPGAAPAPPSGTEIAAAKDDGSIAKPTRERARVEPKPVPQPRFPTRITSSSITLSAGPLPPPAVLKQYDDVVPGLATRIVDMAEAEQKHRHSMDRQLLSSRTGDSRLGIWCGLIISLAFVGAAAFAFHKDHPAAAAVLGSTSLAALVSVFVYGTRSQARRGDDRDSGDDDDDDDEDDTEDGRGD